MKPVVVLLSSDVDRESWRGALEDAGWEVEVASMAAAAVERLRDGGVDVVVADYDVAGGLEVFSAGLTRLPDPPPFVLLSRSLDGPAISAHLGAITFMPKPIPGGELVALVNRAADVKPVPAFIDDQPTRPVHSDEE